MSNKHRILSVVGARPNFMKLAPVARAITGMHALEHRVVHTGQHYDANMSDTFFRDLAIEVPDYDLDVGSASHGIQTGEIMIRLEPVMERERPDTVLVYGDVNSTVAAALVAAKLGVRVGHVEAGLRSQDWTMPEEINRVVTDRLSDLLFVPSEDGVTNLLHEGIEESRIHLVGNVMIDSLCRALPEAHDVGAFPRLGVEPGGYVLVTLHRPSNVDNASTLRGILLALTQLADSLPVVFPVHPRTRARLEALDMEFPAALKLLEPVSYLAMLNFTRAARVVVTDSGGLQEETSYLGVPCVTVRPNTERPVTCALGTNRLVAPEGGAIIGAVESVIATEMPPPPVIPLWDGRTGERICQVLADCV